MNQTATAKENKKTTSSRSTAINGKVVKVTKDMNLAEVVFRYPQAAEILLDYGLHCVGCGASSFDTIEMGAQVHGMAPDEILEMITRINEAITFKE